MLQNEHGAVRVCGENDLCPSAGNKSSCTFVSAPVVIVMFSCCVCSSASRGHQKPSHHLEIKRWEAARKSATSPGSDKESLFWSMKVLLNPLSRFRCSVVLSDGNNCSHHSDKTSVESVLRQQLAVESTTYSWGFFLFLHFFGDVSYRLWLSLALQIK